MPKTSKGYFVPPSPDLQVVFPIRPFQLPPFLPRLAKRAACTLVAPARNLNSFGSRFQPPPHAAGTGQSKLGGMHATEKPLRPTSRLRPHPRRPRPRKTPANSQPAWQRNPAPAVRHHCRTPNQIESFSPVGPASSRKRAIRYRSSTGLAFAFGSACHHQRLVSPVEQMPKHPVPAVEPRHVRTQNPPHPRHQIRLRRLHHQVEMIAHQAIRMHLPARLLSRLP